MKELSGLIRLTRQCYRVTQSIVNRKMVLKYTKHSKKRASHEQALKYLLLQQNRLYAAIDAWIESDGVKLQNK